MWKRRPKSLDVVTARALAPLPELLTMAYPLLKSGAVGLFPKGQDVAVELTEAAKYWNIQSSLIQSRTDAKGQIVIVRGIEPSKPRSGKQAATEGKSADDERVILGAIRRT